MNWQTALIVGIPMAIVLGALVALLSHVGTRTDRLRNRVVDGVIQQRELDERTKEVR